MGKDEAYSTVMGYDLEKAGDLFSDMQGYDVEDGRDLKTHDKCSVLIGYMTKTELFDREIKVRDKLEINGRNFRVVGILKRIGNPIDDMSIIIPLDAAKSVFNDTDEYSMLFVDTRDALN